MIQCRTFKNHYLKNTCNLRHSNLHCTFNILADHLHSSMERKLVKKLLKVDFNRFFLDTNFFPLENTQNQDLVVFMYSRGKYIKLQMKKKS